MVDQLIEAVVTSLGLSKGATIGGFLGALVSLKFIEGLTISQGIVTVFSGMLCAAYISPLVLYAMDMNAKTESAIAFLIGVFGMSFAAAVVKSMPEIISSVRGKLTK